MWKFLLLVITSICICNQVLAQESAARRAFAAGDYSSAVQLFQAAIATANDTALVESLTSSMNKARSCATLLQRANSTYKQGAYAEARANCMKLLAINPSDSNARSLSRLCDGQLAKAAERAADNKLWAEVESSNDISAYKNYLAKYPTGIHAGEARDFVAEEDLWAETKMKNTEAAYREYLGISKLLRYKKESEHKIAIYEDSHRWGIAQQNDTKSAYQNYLSEAGELAQHKKEAQAKIALFDAMTFYVASNYEEARKNFESAKKYYSLNTDQKQAYRICCEESDYNSMQRFPTVSKGRAFLSNYSGSKYTTQVKDLLSRAYCNVHEYATARIYAQTKEAEKYIKEHEKQYKKSSRNTKSYAYKETVYTPKIPSKSRVRSTTEYAINIGFDFDVWSYSYSYTIPRVEFSIGSFQNLVNLAIGLQYRRLTGWNKDDSVEITSDLGYDSDGHEVVPFYSDNLPHLIADQIGIPVTLRFNIGASSASTKAYVATGASLNYNCAAKYKRSLKRLSGEEKTYDRFKNPDASLVNRFNVSTYGKVGLCWKDFDFSIFVRYEATPAFNRDAINTTIMYNDVAPINFYETYKPIQKQVDSKIALGMSFTWNIPL